MHPGASLSCGFLHCQMKVLFPWPHFLICKMGLTEGERVCVLKPHCLVLRAEQALYPCPKTLRPLPALSCCGAALAAGQAWPQPSPCCILTIHLWKEELLVGEEGPGVGSMAPGPLKMPVEVQSSVLEGGSEPGPGPPFPLCSPRSVMMKHQISSIIVTPPKIVGCVFCQSQLMSPAGEQVTLMVIPSPRHQVQSGRHKEGGSGWEAAPGVERRGRWSRSFCLPLCQGHGCAA